MHLLIATRKKMEEGMYFEVPVPVDTMSLHIDANRITVITK